MRRDIFLVYFSPLLLAALGLGLLRLTRPVTLIREEVRGEQLYREVHELARDHYVIPPDEERLAYGAARGILQSLDPNCRVYDRQEWIDDQQISAGRYAGIGVIPRRVGGRFVVLEIVPGSSAAEAGILPGESIVAVEGAAVFGEDGVSESVIEKIRGPRGTLVEVTIRTPGEEARERTVRVERRSVESRTAFGVMLDAERKIGYLAILAFRANTAEIVHREMKHLRSLGIDSLVIDVRENLGGDLDAAVQIAARFVEEGPIVSTVGRRERRVREASSGAPDARLPLVILVDARSASASEVLAGALQDHQRAIMVGERTYGKGTVQTKLPFSTEPGGVKLTTARYFTPAGRSIDRSVARESSKEARGGLVPDLWIELSDRERDACDILRDRMRFNPEIQDLLAKESSVPRDFVDRQLDGALSVLRGESRSDRTLSRRKE